MKTLVRVDNLSFRYLDSVKRALDGVSLEINEGEVVVLAGQSGCGKSTLLRCINGLIPHMYPGEYTGSITVDGDQVDKTPMRALAQKVGLLFQNPENQIFMFSVERDIAFGLENLGVPRARDAPEGGRGHEPPRDSAARPPRPPRALGRSEAEGRPRRRAGHEAAAHHTRRAHLPSRPADRFRARRSHPHAQQGRRTHFRGRGAPARAPRPHRRQDHRHGQRPQGPGGQRSRGPRRPEVSGVRHIGAPDLEALLAAHGRRPRRCPAIRPRPRSWPTR